MSVQTFHPTPVDQSVTNWAVAQRIVGPFAPHAQTVPDMTVAIDAGHLLIGTVLNEVTAQNVGPFTAPASQRVDRIVVDRGTGAASIVAGTEGSANAPQIPLGKLPVARVHLLNGATAITNADIVDERVLNDQSSSVSVICRATLNGVDQTNIPENTYVLVRFSQAEFDVGNSFDAAQHRFVPQVSGFYQISVQLCFSGSPSCIALQIRKNGSPVTGVINTQPSNVYSDVCIASDVVYLNGTTDYVDFTGYKIGDTASFLRGFSSNTFFTANRIG